MIGLGRIGRIVAERGRGLGMRILGHDPYLDASATNLPAGLELLELDDLLERSDFVSVHVPLTASTRHLLSWERLARLKPGARLIDAARGGVVDEEAVLDALESGRLAGAAFDVFEQEPPPKDHPFFGRDDVIVTPHLGASSEEAQLRVAVDVAEQVSSYLLDGVATNAVNAPTLPAEVLHEVAPFTLLAEKLGSFLAQRASRPIRKIELTIGGNVTRFGPEHLRLALLVGLLRHSNVGGVNFVNAPALARERGLFVLENTDDDPQFGQGQISIRARERDSGPTHRVAGTVFGREPRLIHVDGCRIDLPPRGFLLLTRHADRPGVLGKIGTVLGRHQVNIQRLELGPAGQRGRRPAPTGSSRWTRPWHPRSSRRSAAWTASKRSSSSSCSRAAPRRAPALRRHRLRLRLDAFGHGGHRGPRGSRARRGARAPHERRDGGPHPARAGLWPPPRPGGPRSGGGRTHRTTLRRARVARRARAVHRPAPPGQARRDRVRRPAPGRADPRERPRSDRGARRRRLLRRPGRLRGVRGGLPARTERRQARGPRPDRGRLEARRPGRGRHHRPRGGPPCLARFVAYGGVCRRAAVFDAARVSSTSRELRALVPLLLDTDEIRRLRSLPDLATLVPEHRDD